MTFRQKLDRSAEANRSLLCIGLDPDPSRIPARDIEGFLTGIIEATSDLVCAYKANVAFYEALGEGGYRLLHAVRRAVPEGTPLIGDAKRGDVPHTAAAYARALFDELGFDALTVNPYLGRDSLEPFLERADRGVFILCRTSNAGAPDFQDLPLQTDAGPRPLFEIVAERARQWNTRGNVGLVVGATYPNELGRLRALCPELPFLVPGIGAQAGALEASVRAGLDARGAGLILNASRQVLYASGGDDWAQAARREARALREAIERCRAAVAAAPTSDRT